MDVWKRDTDEPALELGPQGSFDDSHIFAPCVAATDHGYRMWYSGSQGQVNERRFALGLAYSEDGLSFSSRKEVFALPGDSSVLTPALLRSATGTPHRIGENLIFYISSCDFIKNDGKHHIYRLKSSDGEQFELDPQALLEDAYAPTVLFVNGLYRMWYVDTATKHWFIRYAYSDDALNWICHPEPVLIVDQEWEQHRVNYPYVLFLNNEFIMWYSSRLDKPGQGPAATAIGVARSQDGIHWVKQPRAILSPDTERAWEAGYCSNPCVLPDHKGGLRMWYSTRPADAMAHKYFAISTARAERRMDQ